MAVMASERQRLRRDYQCFGLHVKRLGHSWVTGACRLLIYSLEYDSMYAIRRHELAFFRHLSLCKRLLLQLFGLSFSCNTDAWGVAKQH